MNKKIDEINDDKGILSLKILAAMSIVGFIISLLGDVGNYITFSNIEALKESDNQAVYEQAETLIEQWEEAGIDVSPTGLTRIATMYAIRSFIDVFAVVGVMLMYYRIMLGYYIYTFFQFLYVAIPFLFLGGLSLLVVPYSSVAITLIYVFLFTTQRKHLKR